MRFLTRGVLNQLTTLKLNIWDDLSKMYRFDGFQFIALAVELVLITASASPTTTVKYVFPACYLLHAAKRLLC